MDEKGRKIELDDKLEGYLNQACEAELAQDYENAERFLKFALFYEGKLLPEVSSPKKYTADVGPVYKKTLIAASSNTHNQN